MAVGDGTVGVSAGIEDRREAPVRTSRLEAAHLAPRRGPPQLAMEDRAVVPDVLTADAAIGILSIRVIREIRGP